MLVGSKKIICWGQTYFFFGWEMKQICLGHKMLLGGIFLFINVKKNGDLNFFWLSQKKVGGPKKMSGLVWSGQESGESMCTNTHTNN